MLPANPSLGEIEERARVIKRRAYRLFCEGKFDQAAEQKAVLELARLIAMRDKIEASRPVKKRRRKATPAPQARELGSASRVQSSALFPRVHPTG
jgi:hypothetical protein